jgi:hypothetical protein
VCATIADIERIVPAQPINALATGLAHDEFERRMLIVEKLMGETLTRSHERTSVQAKSLKSK